MGARRKKGRPQIGPGCHVRARYIVECPRALSPEEWLRFIELRTFTAGWRELGLGDEDLEALQLLIMVDPQRGPVIAGTGGLRKVRFAPSSWHTGKRGAARICYVHFPSFGVVLLVIAYAKNEKDDLTAEERKEIKGLIERFEAWLNR